MQLVRDVIQDLGRFNPEAYMEPEIEVSGVSPAVSCQINGAEMATLNDKIEELEEDLVEAEERMREVLEALEDDNTEDAIKLLNKYLE